MISYRMDIRKVKEMFKRFLAVDQKLQDIDQQDFHTTDLAKQPQRSINQEIFPDDESAKKALEDPSFQSRKAVERMIRQTLGFRGD